MHLNDSNSSLGPVERWGFAWLILALLLLSLKLGGHALIDPDEGRNAAVARGMAESGNYFVPYLDGLPFLDKPFLYFSLGAVSMHLLGSNELAARAPSLVFSWATVLLVMWFAGRWLGRPAAWLAGLACATAPMTITYSRTVIFDSTLSFFMVLALILFYFAVEGARDGSGGDYRLWTAGAWLAMVLGVLTKGPVALVVPLLVVVPFAIWRRASRGVWHPAGWLLFVLAMVGWLWAMEVSEPGFVRYALVTETWNRLTTDELQRTGPIWYFLPYLLGGAFPWVLVLLADGRRRWRQVREGGVDPRVVFLLLWVLLPLVFFSLSQSKRPHYILPVIPAVALLAAWCWQESAAKRLLGVRLGAALWVLLGVLFVVLGAGWVPIRATIPPELKTLIPSTCLALGGAALVAGVLAWLGSRHRLVAPLALSLPLVLLPLVTAPLLREIAAQRSAKALAATLIPRLAPDAAVIGIETFPTSLVFYLDRPLVLSSATGQPVTSNYVYYHYQTLLAAGSPRLLPADGWLAAATACRQPTFFVLKAQYSQERSRLAQLGLPVVFENRKLLAMGPCRKLAPPGDPAPAS